MPTSLIESALSFEHRCQLAQKIAIELNFDSRRYEALAAETSAETGFPISKSMICGYAAKLRAAILRPPGKDPGIAMILRRLEVIP